MTTRHAGPQFLANTQRRNSITRQCATPELNALLIACHTGSKFPASAPRRTSIPGQSATLNIIAASTPCPTTHSWPRAPHQPGPRFSGPRATIHENRRRISSRAHRNQISISPSMYVKTKTRK